MKIKIIENVPQERIDVFWGRVNKGGAIPTHKPELGNCWDWIGFRGKNGYGQFYIGKIPFIAHRVSWAIANGKTDPIPLLHKCDNPACVNPAHLFLGTLSDNTQDMLRKGRCNPPHGERSGSAKFTWEQVQEIRELKKTGIKTRLICQRYQRGRGIINKILAGTIWKRKG